MPSTPSTSLNRHTKFPDLPAGSVKGALLFAGANGADTLCRHIDWTAIQPPLASHIKSRPKLVVYRPDGQVLPESAKRLHPDCGIQLQHAGRQFASTGGRTAVPNLLKQSVPSGITCRTGKHACALTSGAQSELLRPFVQDAV